MQKPDLSVVIITKNEALHIRQCLESIKWAPEIIILDSGSEDETVKICQEYTDQVFETDWPGFGVQKQRAVDKASCDWVLSLDADETVSPALKAELLDAIKKDRFNGFEIPRLSSYCGRQIRHGGWWPDYTLRLFRKTCGRFTPDLVHEHVRLEGRTGRLKSPIQHETYTSLDEVLLKINHYSTLSAAMMQRNGKQSSLTRALCRASWTFFRTYFLRAAILDGREGMMLAISNAETAYYKYLKLLYLQKNSDAP